MPERENHTLVAWHSHRAGATVLENALKALAQNHRVHVRQVFYLLQAQHQDLPKPNIAAGIDFKKIELPINDPTQHAAIYQAVREKVLPKIRDCTHLHINVSPGTPAMHTVWLMLHAGGAFPPNTQLWSSQFVKEDAKPRIDRIEFPINTYLAEIRAQNLTEPNLALYDGEPRSPARREMLQQLARYARLPDAPLLILGERGIGKTRLVETYVKKLKQREKLITVPCGTLDSELAESMLFGHVKGAFTNAATNREGILKEANGGILFLDEIQDLAKSLQRKLVRVFQDREHRFRPLGSDKEEQVDIEIVCASNRHLNDLRNCLDADLFDRLSHLIIKIPPLRECREDLADDWQRVWHELKRDTELPKEAPFSKELEQLFNTHDWAGNLRDLQHLALLCMAWWKEEPTNALKYAMEEWQQRQLTATDAQDEFGSGSWQERTEWFKHRLALWAKQKTGSWSKAAEWLKCSEQTLRNCEKITKNKADDSD